MAKGPSEHDRGEDRLSRCNFPSAHLASIGPQAMMHQIRSIKQSYHFYDNFDTHTDCIFLRIDFFLSLIVNWFSSSRRTFSCLKIL